MWMLSPTAAYHFSELLEGHAVDTYSQFVDENEAILKKLPAPQIARNYYQSSENLFYFDEFQTSNYTQNGVKILRRPTVNTLFDVFINIRDDEGEHVKTMHACQENPNR